MASSQLSTKDIQAVIERLRYKCYRDLTKCSYFKVWQSLNQFIQRLDRKPTNWAQCLTLFVAHLIDSKKQSSTIKGYISTIRTVLKQDGVKINEDTYLLMSLTKACRLVNDRVRTRLPIQKGMLTMLLKQVHKYYGIKKNQPYLEVMYRATFSTAYFGLF